MESKHEVSRRDEDEESECETLRHLNSSSSSSSSAKSRTVYLLIIEKHQQAASSPSSHHLHHIALCCGAGDVWRRGHQVSPAPPPPPPPSLLEDFVRLQEQGGTFHSDTRPDKTGERLLTCCNHLFIPRLAFLFWSAAAHNNPLAAVFAPCGHFCTVPKIQSGAVWKPHCANKSPRVNQMRCQDSPRQRSFTHFL